MKITVIGGANVDITGCSAALLRQYDSNSAHVHISAGGVGRNIAENLIRLGAEATFISAVGDDSFAPVLEGLLEKAGLDTSRLIRRRGMNTGLYLALLQKGGEFYIAVNDMEAVESILPADIESQKSLLGNSDLIVAEANLLPETLQALAAAAGAIPLMADTVSASKAGRLRGILPRLEILKTNRAEAEVLCGYALDSREKLEQGCRQLLDAGPRRLYITLGAEGSCCASPEGIFIQPNLKAHKVNVNGAGDAFAAGAAYSYCLGASVEAGGAFGTACAAITIESEDGVCKTLNRNLVEERLAINQPLRTNKE